MALVLKEGRLNISCLPFLTTEVTEVKTKQRKSLGVKN